MPQRLKILYFLLFLFGVQKIVAQTYGNEWINYNQSYYKFQIYQDSIYRIPISSLFALGMPNSVQGDNLQVFRDGNEIPIFVSNQGVLNGSDYIEFWGTKANSKVDEPLYISTNDILNPDINIVSDTAYYFITFNNSNTNKRYTLLNNSIQNPPIAEAFFWDRINLNYRNVFSGGKSYEGANVVPVSYQYSSQYEQGEGYCKSFTANKDSIVFTCLYPYKNGGLFATVSTAVVGNSYLTDHWLKLYANSNEIADVHYGAFESKKIIATFPMTYLTAQNKMSVRYSPLNANPNFPDRFGISYSHLRYPRLFNFGNKSSFYFELNPKLQDYYLEIQNFNYGNISPRLYDLNENKYLIGDISQSGIVKFLIPASNSVKSLVLQSYSSNDFGQVSNLQPVIFKNFTQTANQGDYIIITHNAYFNDGNGYNHIADYKAYRNSIAGGSFYSTIADVNDLYNEFGYGYQYSTLALKNFLHYAAKNPQWNYKPKFAFIIGKGLSYYRYKTYSEAPYSTYPFYAVPSFGDPCSDILLTDFDKNNQPQIPIGRLAVMNGSEVKNYLDKVKDYEMQVNDNSHQYSDSTLWKKRVLHLAGTRDAAQQLPIYQALLGQNNIISAPYFGGGVTTLRKSSTDEVELANSEVIDKLFNGGISLVQFFGHGSSQTLDYNLDFPENYKNYKKYNVFIANGCSAGDMFILQGAKSLGERFVLAPNAASVAFIASNNTGWVSQLKTFTDTLYSIFSYKNYGKSLGEQLLLNALTLHSKAIVDGNLRTHIEQIGLNGDPAIKLYNFQLPDYAVEEKGINFSEINLTSSIDSFTAQILIHNLGRYQKDTFEVNITRTLPDNSIENILTKQYIGLANTDTINVHVATYGTNALGINSLNVSIDDANLITEISESNNYIKRNFTIYNDDLVPVYPYDLSIVTNQGVTLKSSTLNSFIESRKYVIQIDTTKKFNSPLLQSTNIESAGGVVKWQPMMTMQDSVVYYWRTAMDTLYGNHYHKWTNSSFVFLSQSTPGWNQSHYDQFNENQYTGIYLDSASRLVKFDNLNKKLQVQTVCLRGPSPYDYGAFNYLAKINGTSIYTYGCGTRLSNLQVIVIDSITGKPWVNRVQPNGRGNYGSIAPCRMDYGNGFEDPFFEFCMYFEADRISFMNFLDSIPTGNFVLIRNRVCIGKSCGVLNATFIKQWKADTLLYGSGVSAYHKLKNIGFTQIDSFTKNRPFSFFMKAGHPNSIIQHVGIDSTVNLYAEYNFNSSVYDGDMNAAKIGPAKLWSHFYRYGYSIDGQATDTTSIQIVGIDANGTESLLTTVKGDTSLQFINANQYPYLKLKMNLIDNIHATAEQTKYWRVHFQPVPEAALNANRQFSLKDTINQGETQHLKLAIENLTEMPMDSMLVKISLVDKNKNINPIATKRFKPLPILDTIHIDYDIESLNLRGEQTLLVEANPNNDQLEQYHPNNLGYKNFYVMPDNNNPIIDVTFDGVHIFDKHIVSAKPSILITLKDDNKYLALDDTSLVSVFLKYPGEAFTIEHQIPFDGNVLKFIPPTNLNDGKNNKAKIEFNPNFTEDGDDYVLTVRAKDKSGNSAGKNSYKVQFEVVNKPSITNLINYPNPFTTSTQFIFTITGSQIPSNLKIQILTPTGRVVREITKAELGNLHIGRNITEFKWRGDDQYGKLLGNGVYLYRFISNLNGQKMEHRDSGADQWIEKGFGKLYIMR
ncbi:MAG TPA: C25 family cysteine peptidase [Chitinophagaceae bacterium]|nr:C25 family cysteine peptidase [Chitinophagaceae bacterium]